jgi:hypothetical protein
MIRVCYYKGCGVVYGEKKPLSDKSITHGLCPKHLKISRKEIKAEMKKKSMVNRENQSRNTVFLVEKYRDHLIYIFGHFQQNDVLRAPTIDFNGRRNSVVRKESNMLWTICVILLILWLLGLLTGYTMGGVIHILLVIAIVVVVVRVIRGRKIL